MTISLRFQYFAASYFIVFSISAALNVSQYSSRKSQIKCLLAIDIVLPE